MRRLALLALLIPTLALAVPGRLTHQGALTDSLGVALDGTYNLTFRLYDAATGGAAVWTETVSAQVVEGSYSVQLGQSTPVADVLGGGTLYLSIAVDGGAELEPRVPVNSVPYAVRAGVAEALAGELAWSSITGVPTGLSDGDADTLGALGCSAGQVASFDGAAWACATPASGGGGDAGAITTGTLSVDRLPVGTGPNTVAAGDHTHAFSTITGQAAYSQLPVGTTANTVAAGNHTHTAAEVGAIPTTGGAVDGSLALAGTLTVGGTTATCNTALAGTIRWTGAQLEVCNGAAWSNLAQAELGSSDALPGDSCKAIKAARPAAPSGAYWVKVPATGGTRLVYCDQVNDGGGWTLAVNIFSDLGAINLYTYNNQNTNYLTANYGVNLAEMGASTSTEYRLSCVESSDNATRKMFIKGLIPTEPIFQAAGTITKTGLVCANNANFTSPVNGAGCLLVDDGNHTYYGTAAWDMDWALYSVGSAYTLRHCRNIGTGYHNKGGLWYR